VLFVLWNGLQIDGTIERVKNIEPVAERIKAFGWETLEIDGHDIDAIAKAIDRPRQSSAKPLAIVARTTMSKGVSYMENDKKWHGGCPTKEQVEKAFAELGKASSYSDYPAAGGVK
jgi:transketolase